MKRIAALDGLRGVAALAVVVNHAVCVGTHFTADPLIGAYGVDVFFALSGFLIGGILLDSAGSPGWVQRFVVRRSLRIWPLCFLVLALVSFTWRHTPSGWMTWVFAENLRQTFVLHHPPNRIALGVFWSLAVEEHAYLLLPILIRCSPRRQLPLALIAICALAFLSRLYFWETQQSGGNAPWSLYVFTPCRLDSIAVGVFVAWFVRERPVATPAFRLAAIGGSGLFAVILVTQQHFWYRPGSWVGVLLEPLPAYAAAAAIGWFVTEPRTLAARVFGWRPLAWLGTISYGLYLWHPLVLEVLPAWAVAATIPLAWVSWTFYEKPFLDGSLRERASGFVKSLKISLRPSD